MGTRSNPCTLQWLYMTGNSPDSYPEAFRNCADFELVAAPAQAALRGSDDHFQAACTGPLDRSFRVCSLCSDRFRRRALNLCPSVRGWLSIGSDAVTVGRPSG